jgi:L-ribulokinase
MNDKYTLGIDFGSLSVRTAAYRVRDGKQIGECVSEYRNGVMDEVLPASGIRLPDGSALQDPNDFVESMEASAKGLLSESGIDPHDIIGVGVDFTACTLVAIDENCEPLCNKSEFRDNIHAYAKMWKQHTASEETRMINDIAVERKESFLKRYGNKVLSEWGIPKILETARKAPDVYRATYKFIEAGDWITSKLTGKLSTNYCMASFKFFWDHTDGYPDEAFFEALDPSMKDVVRDKLFPREEIHALDECVGVISKDGATLTGLLEGTPVVAARIDGHSTPAAIGVSTPGNWVLVIGTGMGTMILSEKEKFLDGIGGVSYGSILPGLYGYEAGLSGCGDIFEWCVKTCTSAALEKEAKEKNVKPIELLTEKATHKNVGESGLLSLDWWNGNRSVLVDTDLTGMILGLTLQSKPEDIFRSTLEATGFCLKIIMDNYVDNDIEVEKVYAVGGIAKKNKLLMQIYADIFNREVIVPDVAQTCAKGSAVYAAVAAGSESGGYDSLDIAIGAMYNEDEVIYRPNPENVGLYQELFNEYKILHDYFGRGENPVMKKLNKMKQSARADTDQAVFDFSKYIGQPMICDCGREHATPIEAVEIGENAMDTLPEYLRRFGYKKPMIVCDAITYDIAGEQVMSILKRSGFEDVSKKVFTTKRFVPDEKALAELLIEADKDCDVLIAVGTGSINDLVRYFSYKTGRRFITIATATPMDGFASSIAALIVDDFKTTYEAQSPLVIIGDTGILKNAPMPMITAGLSDILGKFTCLCDWKISRIVNQEYYCQTVVDIVDDCANNILNNAPLVMQREPVFIGKIMEALVLSGIMISYIGNSRPGSGCEHHLSHFWEMKFAEEGRPPVLHGVQVGVGTVIILELAELLSETTIDFEKARNHAKIYDQDAWKKEIRGAYGKAADGVIRLEQRAGKNNSGAILSRLTVIEQEWDEIRKLLAALPKAKVVIDLLKQLEAPFAAEQIGLSKEILKNSILYAKDTRDRYTILQLIWDLGLSEDFAEKMIGINESYREENGK